LDKTDGDTTEAGLTITQADVLLSKNGAGFAQKNDATGCTHDVAGMYACPLNATDTATLGRLQLFCHESGALAVWHDFMIIPANVFDALVGDTDKLHVDAVEISSSTDAADNVEANIGNLDHSVTTVDTVCDAIKAKTDNLPADPADDSDIDGQLATIAGHLTDIKGTGFAKDTHSLTDVLADVTGLNGDAMRGTDSAALASVCTAARLAELDGANLPADIDAIKAKTDNLPADPADDSDIDGQLATIATHLTDIKGTGFVKDTDSLTDILTNVTGLTGDAMRGTDSAALASVCTEARLAQLPTIITHLTDIKGTDFLKNTHSLTDILADVTGINGDAMRGTDSAALASVCTEGRLAELAAANLPADIDAIKAKTDNLPADPADDSDIDSQLSTITDHLTDIKGTGFVKNTHSLTDILTDVTGLNGDAMRGTNSAALAAVCTEPRLAELAAANLPADVDAIITHLTDIKGTGFAKDTHSLTDILSDVTGVNGDAMRGTDSAALATVCTEARLVELDAANVPADIAAVATQLTDIKGTGFVKDTHSLPQCLTAAGFSVHDAPAVATALMAKTGVTAGGTYTVNDLMKALGAFILGTWQDKAGEGGAVQELLDWEDDVTVILELTSSGTSPYKTTTKK